MSESTPPSLRGLYTAPTDSWAFIPAAEVRSSNSPAPPLAGSSRWTPRNTTKSHVFELSPALQENATIDLRVLLKGLFSAGLLQYASTAIAMPFEVGRVLLQVQWVPKELPNTFDNGLEIEMEPEEENVCGNTVMVGFMKLMRVDRQ
jgi:mitochondrial fusion and transport protein UGO1